MRDVPVSKTRNFAIAGHASTGKTALADLILAKSGKVTRLGKTEDKTSVSDYRDDEKERGYSVYAASLNCEWKSHQIFFVDTPGSPDFQGETVAALAVCDLALVVVDGVTGIEIGTSRAMRQARQRNCPRALFINSLDRDNADFDRVLESLKETYGRTAVVPLTLPQGSPGALAGVSHVLRGDDAPPELAEDIEKYKGMLLDTVAESDEELMLRYLEGEELTEEEISKGLHQAIMAGDLIPVFCGSVANDIGVAELMDGIVNLFPDPLMQGTVPLEDGELTLADDGDCVAFVFKSIVDPFIGQMTILRVYSGVLRGDSELQNLSKRQTERYGQLLVLNGKEQQAVAEAGPGDIVAIAKLKDTHINNTLSTAKSGECFPPVDFPRPTMSYACYALKPGEEDKIATGLHRLCEEDRTIVVVRNAETHELILSGLGDQHLSTIVERLKTNSNVEVDLRKPKVPYRETITGKANARYRHKKQTGGHGQFAEVWLRVEPLAGADFEFDSEVVGGRIPKNFIPAVEKGISGTLSEGPLANCKVTNVKAIVYDGKHHDVDSSDLAFQIAGRSAFREAMRSASPILLEPIMKLTISAPGDYMGDISGDLNQRRGRILGMGSEDGMQLVEAEVPMAEMFSYSSQLRSLTQGRGSFSMDFARYEQVPGNIAKQVQEEASKASESE